MKLIIAPHLMFTLMLFSCEKKHESVSPIFSPITEAVFASGYIEPAGQYMLTVLNEGYLKKGWVKEGDIVSTGEVLFTQDNAMGAIEKKAAQNNLRIVKQTASSNSPVLQQLRAQLKTAQDKLDNDSLQYMRMRRLYETNSVSRTEMENAQLAFQNSLSTLESIHENILASGFSLQQDLINTEKLYQESLASSTYFQLKSKGIYKVYKIMKKEGELLRKGDAIALLGQPDSMLAVLQIDETSISRIRIGQKVLIELNTHKGKTYEARIVNIHPYFDDIAQAYKVEAAFDINPDAIAGTLLQSNIITARKGKALLIPRICLIDEEKVIIERENRLDTVLVKTGIISSEWVEILQGINVNDKLLKAR